MIIKTKKEIASHEITDPVIFNQRRIIIKTLLASVFSGSTISSVLAKSETDWKDLSKTDLLAKIRNSYPY